MSSEVTSTESAKSRARRAPVLRLVSPVDRLSHAPSPPPGPDPADATVRVQVESPEVDRWWLEALRRGESSALARLYREHHEPVRALVRRLLNPTSDVEDIVHDVFVAAPAAFRGYRGEGTVRSYLFTIAVNYVRRHVRTTVRRRTWLERLQLVPTREGPVPPDTHSERRQLADRLRGALETLSFDHREVVVLCEIEEMTSVEAARVLGVPEGTVRTRLHHAKRKLRAYLEGSSHEHG